MAQYKVIQDIEAEDKLVGPLTLRQLIYAGIAALCLYICFLAYTKGAPFLIAFFLPIALGAGFFGFPWKGEQATEIWALARLRFMLKPRVRIWDQDGVKDLVTVIAPRRPAITRASSKASMSQSEVRSRLKALADTIDSRGWATRNAAYGMYNQQWQHPVVAPTPDPNPLAAMIPSDDMFDDSSPVAQNFDAMLNKSEERKRQRVIEQMAEAQAPAAPAAIQSPSQSTAYQMPQLPTPVMPAALPTMPMPDMSQAYASAPQSAAPYDPAQSAQPQGNYWFANGPAYPVNPAPATPLQPGAGTMPAPVAAFDPRIESDMPLTTAATPTAEDLAMSENIRQQNESAMSINYGHMRVLQPTANSNGAGSVPINYQDSSQIPPATNDPSATSSTLQSEPVTHTPDPAILELANNDDLDIATIARQANKEIGKSPDEVEIRLH